MPGTCAPPGEVVSASGATCRVLLYLQLPALAKVTRETAASARAGYLAKRPRMAARISASSSMQRTCPCRNSAISATSSGGTPSPVSIWL